MAGDPRFRAASGGGFDSGSVRPSKGGDRTEFKNAQIHMGDEEAQSAERREKMSYAEKTSVPIDRSKAEIGRILGKYGATSFVYGEQGPLSVVAFEMSGRRIKFILPMPTMKDCRNQGELDQRSRARWRCLVLAIKAKLECVESGITTLEQEFMAHIVLPGGQTVGQAMTPQIALAYSENKMPPLLGYDP